MLQRDTTSSYKNLTCYFKLGIQEKIVAIGGEFSADSKWTAINCAYDRIVSEVLGTKSYKSKEWIFDHTWDLIKERGAQKNLRPATSGPQAANGRLLTNEDVQTERFTEFFTDILNKATSSLPRNPLGVRSIR